MSAQFTCEVCGRGFTNPPDWTEDKLRAEYEERFPEAARATADQFATLCDVCYGEFNAWFEGLPAGERRRMKAAARRSVGRHGRKP